MKVKLYPLDYDHFEIDGKYFMKVFCKTSDNKTCCIIDKPINYFYIFSDKIDKLKDKIKQKYEIIDKNFLGSKRKAIKIFCEFGDMQDIKNELEKYDPNIESKERDLGLITRYIIENSFKPLKWYDAEVENITKEEYNGISESLNVDFVFKLKKITELKDELITPKVLAFDIEAEEFEIGKGEILMISLVSENYRKVITWKKCSISPDYVECLNSEKEVIEKFAEYIEKVNPDIITGYFSDGFDFPYLRARAEKNKVNLKIGRDDSKIIFTRGKPLTSKIKGRVHVDIYKFIETAYSQYLTSETLGLNEVAKELIGDSKLIADHEKLSSERNDEDWSNYFRYNLQDSILTYKLFMKLWPDILEFTRMIQEPLHSVSRFSLSHMVESYLIHNLNRFNEVAERRPNYEEIEQRKMRKKYEGAFVFQPTPGLYEELAAFDFTSMHGSIINTFNLSEATLLDKKEENSFEVELTEGKKYYFSKKPSFFPILIGELIERRKELKKQLKENPDAIIKARSNAAKLLVNASYGYLGFFGARWYSPEAAACTLALVRKFIHEMIEKTNKENYKIIYADTDSIFFLTNKKTKEETLNYLKKLNDSLPGIMQLDLEDFYKRGIWVSKKTGELGAKKKYALINYDNKLKIRGFETVRRDWCSLSRNLQNNVLQMILKSGEYKEALEYVKEIVKKIKTRKIDKKDLAIRTQLKKPLAEYKANSPHVTIAKKMLSHGLPVDVGMLIEYYIAESKDEKALVRDKAKLLDEKGDYDISYYLDHQIIPAIENIFEVFKIKNEDIKGKSQKNLFDFKL